MQIPPPMFTNNEEARETVKLNAVPEGTHETPSLSTTQQLNTTGK